MAEPFQRVWVDYMIKGTSRISWTFARHFLDPDPASWTYQLQVSEHGLLPAKNSEGVLRSDDWTSLGSPATNAGYLTDATRRAFGKTLLISYRVKLVTGVATYYSPPATTLGALNKQDWLRVQEIIRKEKLLHRVATSTEGFLLRRKRSGAACTRCLDPRTKEVTLSKCTLCLGTRFLGGYFAAVAGTYCRVEPNSTREQQNLQTGPEKQDVTKGRVIAVPGMESLDVWIDGDSDLRYYVHVTDVLAQIRNVPVILGVELRQAPFDDVIYSFSLSGA